MTLTRFNGLPVSHHWTRFESMIALAAVYQESEMDRLALVTAKVSEPRQAIEEDSADA